MTPIRSKKGLRGDLDDTVEILSQSNEILTVTGTLFYHDSVHAWNTLRLKKEIVDKFPGLKNKSAKGMYIMKLPTSYEALKKEIESLQEQTEAVPIMIFLGQEKKEQSD